MTISFYFIYLFYFISLFFCNLYHFNVISGKFMFVIALNSVKNEVFSNIDIGQISL